MRIDYSKLIIGLCVLACLGCASRSYMATKATATQQEHARDNYECVQQSRTSWSGGGFGLIGLAVMAGSHANAQAQADSLYKMCMEARGYMLTEQAQQQNDPQNRSVIYQIPK